MARRKYTHQPDLAFSAQLSDLDGTDQSGLTAAGFVIASYSPIIGSVLFASGETPAAALESALSVEDDSERDEQAAGFADAGIVAGDDEDMRMSKLHWTLSFATQALIDEVRDSAGGFGCLAWEGISEPKILCTRAEYAALPE